MRRILLNAKVPMNVACLRPLVRRLVRDPQLSLTLTSRYRGTRWWPSRLKRVLPSSHSVFEEIPTLPSPLANMRKFDLFLSPDMVPTGAKRTEKRIHLFHGVSFKGASITPKAKEYSHLYLFGEYQRRRFVEKGIFEEGDPRLCLIGWPKLDCLVDGTLDQDQLRHDQGLRPDLPTVLYAPTWRGTSLDAEGEEIVRAISAMDVNLLIKLHDHSLDPGLAKREWLQVLNAWRDLPNVSVYSDPDICPAMMMADVLVSDFSSVSNEFTLLDRPIVFFDTEDLAACYSAKQIDHAMLERRPGRIVTSAAALPEVIGHALAHPEEHSEARRSLAADLFHQPGHATDNAIRSIYEVLGVDMPTA